MDVHKLHWNMVSVDDWTSGFFPGVLWYDYEYSREPEIKEKAVYFTRLLEPLSHKVTSHDLGFQIFCSYGNAYRLTKDKYYKDVIPKVRKNCQNCIIPGSELFCHGRGKLRKMVGRTIQS